VSGTDVASSGGRKPIVTPGRGILQEVLREQRRDHVEPMSSPSSSRTAAIRIRRHSTPQIDRMAPHQRFSMSRVARPAGRLMHDAAVISNSSGTISAPSVRPKPAGPFPGHPLSQSTETVRAWGLRSSNFSTCVRYAGQVDLHRIAVEPVLPDAQGRRDAAGGR